MVLYAIFSAILGLIIGSFLNVVTLRFRTGRTLGGRSICMSCQREIRWFDLIPLLSFLMLGGRCRSCDARIRWQYPAVEFATGLVFLLVWLVFGWSWQLPVFWIVGILLVILSVYDMRHEILPDPFVAHLGIWALVILIIPSLRLEPVYQLVTDSFVFDHVLAMFAVPAFFFILWLVSEGRWFGLGDVKLMAVMGLMLGMWQGFEAVVLAFWLAMLWVIAVGVMVLGRRIREKMRGGHRVFHMYRRIPFGPFLALSLFLEILGIHVFQLLLV